MAAKIRYDEWIKAVRPNAADTSDPLIVLEGFIGKSNVDKHIRVYSDEALSQFIEVLESDIIHCIDLKDSPLGGSKLWLNAEAVYTYGDPAAKKRQKASFLHGDLAGTELQAAIPPTRICTVGIGCWQTRIQPQCCGGVSVVFSPQVNCTRTLMVSCYATCNITCVRTCNILICRDTIIRTPCIQFTPTDWRITPTTPQVGQFQQNFNPFGGGTGFEGYDPYQQGM